MNTPPYFEGYKAQAAGVPYEDNPYNENPFFIFRQEWFKGWEASLREEEWYKIV